MSGMEFGNQLGVELSGVGPSNGPAFSVSDRRKSPTLIPLVYDRRTQLVSLTPLPDFADLPKLGLVLIALALSWACASPSSSKPASFFPLTNEVPNWTKVGETRTFSASQLSDYIDGDAEKYIRAGVEQTQTADYRYSDKSDAVADVFVMKSAEGAASVFESQPAAGSETIQLGDAARLYPGNLSLRKGRTFVRLVAYDNSPETQQALVVLGRAIAAKL